MATTAAAAPSNALGKFEPPTPTKKLQEFTKFIASQLAAGLLHTDTTFLLLPICTTCSSSTHIQ
ncbi:hypothetical protein KY290_013476 [Solanum tuberosum]|uniref:Uncharacterized protein n=1 Tax=Solanum tuberosum TaxID=4113 RepID=A0ABQ7VLU3_SOLTU|nr:hypothetical protein KY289_013597 [Solanum tuberosum]KAH0769495.1 hypothetical protein KY290_013476 [Solanum tuberosum]